VLFSERPVIAVKWIALLLYNVEVRNLNTGLETSYPDWLCGFLQSLHENSGIVLKIRPQSFSCPFDSLFNHNHTILCYSETPV
jgi:hypothetical protein